MIEPNLALSLAHINNVLTLLFAGEVALKLLAYSASEFWGDAFNIFDAVVVAAGLFELVSDIGHSVSVFRAFRIFKIFRVLKVLRVVSFLAPLKTVSRVIVRTLGGLVGILILNFMFVFIFSVLGMQLFGGKLGRGDDRPRWNFDTFFMAFTTTFQIMTYDSWNLVLYDTVAAVGPSATVFFVVWIVTGSLVLMNLLLVIILESYLSEAEAPDSDDEDEDASPIELCEDGHVVIYESDCGNHTVNPAPFEMSHEHSGEAMIADGDKAASVDDEERQAKVSLGLFPMHSPLRITW